MFPSNSKPCIAAVTHTVRCVATFVHEFDGLCVTLPRLCLSWFVVGGWPVALRPMMQLHQQHLHVCAGSNKAGLVVQQDGTAAKEYSASGGKGTVRSLTLGLCR